jgi:hypothetical protein
MDINSLKYILVDSGITDEEELIGCSEEAISDIEKNINHELPQSYRTFLSICGVSAGEYLKGTDIFYDVILDLQQWGAELLEESGAIEKLPNNAFIFFMHQGYELGYFLLSDDDDPPVFFYTEGDASPVRKWNSFTDFIEQVIIGQKE